MGVILSIEVQDLPLSESKSRLPLGHIRNRKRIRKSNQMKSLILYRVNGQAERLVDWNQVNWVTTYKLLRNLQRRIFRAKKLGQWKQLRRLQKLLLRSYANLLESVRRITQDNSGKNTPGVDKEVINTPEDRVKLAKLVHIDEGFNFLGFYVRRYDSKLLIKPQKEKVLAFCKKVGETIKKMATAKQISLIRKLNPILRGFANYYQKAVSKDIFSYISHRVWEYLWKWCKRRHPKKRLRWVKDKYFHTIEEIDWTFCCMTKDRRGNPRIFNLYNIEKTPIVRHTKIKGTNSPFDAEEANYWEKRNARMGKTKWAKGSKYDQVATNQNYKCPNCGLSLFNGESIETHHIALVKDGGSDDIENLIHLHTACHKQEHSKTKFKAGSMA